MSKIQRFFLVLGLIFTTQVANAMDVITLKNGDVYRGEIIHQEIDKYIQIKLNDGNEKRLKWNEVKSTAKEESVQQQAKQNSNKAVSPKGTSKIKIGLIVSGATYVATAVVGAATGASYTVIPVVGPLIQVSKNTTRAWDTANYASTVIQTAGLVFATIGIYQRAKSKEEAGNSVSVQPWFDDKATGLMLSAQW